MYDAIIIGAGMSGLAAGIRLAHYEKRVCILERHTTIGGLNSFYRLRGRNYDVGLHAVTNYTAKGSKKGPLARLLRQLRFSWDDFALKQQVGSAIAFPSAKLDFTNDIDVLRAEVARAFPREIDNFERLIGAIPEFDALALETADASAREFVGGIIRDPLLVDMLFCPLMYYGSARENDMDLAQFFIMFRSIFLEGFARPAEGIRPILKQLVRRYKELGGELKLRAGVRRIVHDGGCAIGVELDDGTQLEARQVLSSAGYVETMRLCERAEPEAESEGGQLSFIETMAALDRPPRELGCDKTIVFFSTEDRFHWHRPTELVDLRSGVLCVPDNFQFEEPSSENLVRMTALADFAGWNRLSREDYLREKERWFAALTETSLRFLPDIRPHTVETDMFTPTTVVRYTGHVGGAIYGAPKKRYDGMTFLPNLFLCGTDQGFVGIIGALVSGISMANRHLLQTPAV
ncbi:MAG: NAD(P)/FAD-dependent oxidoreductase [Planctomycetia bacterium]|nr:NAD(P)/FAD-dependent oxidoreductase [Planctomycetia bacterium]